MRLGTKITLAGDWTATVTDDPLRSTPRFDFPGQCVRIAEFADVDEWQRFLVETFGSQEWLWDDPDELRFARTAGSWSAPGSGCPMSPLPPTAVPAFPSRRRYARAGLGRTRPGTSAWRRPQNSAAPPETPRSPADATSTSSTSRWKRASAPAPVGQFDADAFTQGQGAKAVQGAGRYLDDRLLDLGGALADGRCRSCSAGDLPVAGCAERDRLDSCFATNVLPPCIGAFVRAR